jgi:DNA-binding MarR family transcriptional regulator
MPRTTSSPESSALTELPDVLQFMQLLWAVVHALERTSKRMSGEIGVTGPQRLVLRVVGLSPGLSAGDLAAVLHVHPSTLTGVLQRLVSQRLLARSDDPRDRRRAILRLTDEAPAPMRSGKAPSKPRSRRRSGTSPSRIAQRHAACSVGSPPIWNSRWRVRRRALASTAAGPPATG